MPAYEINYLWIYNSHGEDGPAVFDQEIGLRVRYHIQPDEPDVNVKFEITIEEIWNGDVPLCTDAALECGWYSRDEERLLEWLLDGKYAEGKPVALAAPAASATEARRAETAQTDSVHDGAGPQDDAQKAPLSPPNSAGG